MSKLIRKHLEALILENADKQTIAEVERHRVLIDKRFDEGKHKRDSGGQFSTQEGDKAPKEKKPKKPQKQRKERKPGDISQKEARYTDSSKVSGQRCSNCINILRIKNSPIRRCTKVEGIILDSGWSRFWKASRKAEDPTRV